MNKNPLIENIKKSLLNKLKEDLDKEDDNEEVDIKKRPKAKVDIKSALEEIMPFIYNAKNVVEIRDLLTDYLKDSKIKGKDTILSNANKINNIVRLQIYIGNSLLQYEGHGLNQLKENNELIDQPEINYDIEDQIGKFFVVTKALKESGEDDLLKETDVFGLAEMINNGLTKEEITGLYKTESKARNNSKKSLKQRDNDLKEDVKTGKSVLQKLIDSIEETKLEISGLTDRGMNEPGTRDSISSDLDKLYKKLDKREILLDKLKRSLDKESKSKKDEKQV